MIFHETKKPEADPALIRGQAPRASYYRENCSEAFAFVSSSTDRAVAAFQSRLTSDKILNETLFMRRNVLCASRIYGATVIHGF